MKELIATVIVACAALASVGAHADSYNGVEIVPPAKLPESVRHDGDSMLLRETNDGRELLYIEQDNGSKIATLDVSDPAHVESGGTVQLGNSGVFDFVLPLGENSELIRFRQGQGNAVLDFRKYKVPTLGSAQGLMLSSSGEGEAWAREPQMRKELVNTHSGTTFVLTQSGLYLIRRPAVEWERKRREQEWFEQHTGG